VKLQDPTVVILGHLGCLIISFGKFGFFFEIELSKA